MMPKDSLVSRALRAALTTALTASFLLGHVAPAAAQAADPNYAAGVAAFAAGDYAKTVNDMNASLAQSPTGKAALYLGNAYLKLGQLGAAKAALQRALQLDPANPKKEAILKLIKGIHEKDAAKVRITSTPPGATIYLEAPKEGAGHGKTPTELYLTPGRHEVFVVLDGHETQTQVQQFKSGEKATLDFALRPNGCAVSLSAEPADARAAVDGGEPVALPAETRVGVGAHKVTFTAAGFEAKELELACDGSKPLVLGAKLVAVVRVGRVKLAAAPPGTVIAVDGRVLSAAELAAGVTLPVGRHEVSFTIGGKPPYTQVIEVTADAEVTVAPPPVAPPPPTPPPARVGFPERGIYLGLVGGANLTLVEWNLGTDTKGAYPKSSATGGLRVGVQLIPRLAIEGEAQWIGLPNRLEGGLGHGLATDVNALFHILKGKWTPVVEAGAGTYQVLSSALGADADLRLHAGVGLRGALNNWLNLRADVRDVITDGFDKSVGNNLEVLLGVETFLWERKP